MTAILSEFKVLLKERERGKKEERKELKDLIIIRQDVSSVISIGKTTIIRFYKIGFAQIAFKGKKSFLQIVYII